MAWCMVRVWNFGPLGLVLLDRGIGPILVLGLG